jgi:aminocarboxymuconate-semialdehyde decarboxylase
MTPSVDIQGHFMPDAHWRALAAESERHPDFRRFAGVVVGADESSKVRRLDDARIGEMDAAQLDVMVISLLPPAVSFGTPQQAAALARDANDGLIEAAARYPGRFLVIASLPMPYVEESLAELERIAKEPLVRGIQVMAKTIDWTPDDARFEPLYRRIAELGLPAVLHPPLEPLPSVFDGWGLGSSIGTMLSTTLGGLRLVLTGMLDRVPDLELVIPHLGGTIPYLTRRVQDLNGQGDAEHELIHYLRKRIYYDSCSYQPEALRCAVDTVGADRIMLASDYPFRGELEVCVRDIAEADLAAEAREAILGGTARRWFDAASTNERVVKQPFVR